MRAFYFALIFKASAAEEHAALAQLAQLGQYALDLAELTFTRKVQKKKMLKKYTQLIADQEELYNSCNEEDAPKDINMPDEGVLNDKCEPIFQLTAGLTHWTTQYLKKVCDKKDKEKKKFIRSKIDKMIKQLDKKAKNADRKNKCPLVTTTTGTTSTTATTLVCTCPHFNMFCPKDGFESVIVGTMPGACQCTKRECQYSCGARLQFSTRNKELKDLKGLWTLAMNEDGTVKTNDEYPYYKRRDSDDFMWWMWHGDVGHWVINKTPGSHGGDRAKSVFGDFECPQKKKEWEIADGVKFIPKKCCQKFELTTGGATSLFERTDVNNEEYPIYRSGSSAMWWMWHGPVGHWVLNETPGAHGGDQLKSAFGDAVCPDEIENWELSNDASVKCVK